MTSLPCTAALRDTHLPFCVSGSNSRVCIYRLDQCVCIAQTVSRCYFSALADFMASTLSVSCLPPCSGNCQTCKHKQIAQASQLCLGPIHPVVEAKMISVLQVPGYPAGYDINYVLWGVTGAQAAAMTNNGKLWDT